MKIKVRIAEQNDLNSIAVLFDAYRVFYKQISNLSAALNFLKERMDLKESVIIVAEYEGELIGFTQLYPKFSSVSLARDYVLNDLYVDQVYRDKKVGKKLLNYAQDLVKTKGFKGLMLETEINNPAQHLYEREGWVKDQDHFFYYWTNQDYHN